MDSSSRNGVHGICRSDRSTNVAEVGCSVRVLASRRGRGAASFRCLPLAEVVRSGGALYVSSRCSFPTVELSTGDGLESGVTRVRTSVRFCGGGLRRCQCARQAISSKRLCGFLVLYTVGEVSPLLSSFVGRSTVRP